MKKLLAVLALALFIGGISVPVIAANQNAQTLISLQDDDPKKKAEGEKTEKKAEATKEATHSGDCSTEAKSEVTKEKTEATKEKAETAKPATSGGCG